MGWDRTEEHHINGVKRFFAVVISEGKVPKLNGQSSLGCSKVSGKVKITQTRSTIGRLKKQEHIIRALGIKKLYHSVEHADTPQVRGMIEKVKHLVRIEEV